MLINCYDWNKLRKEKVFQRIFQSFICSFCFWNWNSLGNFWWPFIPRTSTAPRARRAAFWHPGPALDLILFSSCPFRTHQVLLSKDHRHQRMASRETQNKCWLQKEKVVRLTLARLTQGQVHSNCSALLGHVMKDWAEDHFNQKFFFPNSRALSRNGQPQGLHTNCEWAAKLVTQRSWHFLFQCWVSSHFSPSWKNVGAPSSSQ